MTSKQHFAFTYPCPRNLREIVKLTLFEREPRDKVCDLWIDYHRERLKNVAHILSKSEFQTLQKNTKDASMFLVPVRSKHGGGHYMLLGQAQKKSFMFTYLEDYKKFGQNASPYFILTCFDELMFSKEIALLRGDITDHKMDRQDAQYVMQNTLRLYLTPQLYTDYVYNFNHNQKEFKYDKFIKEFQLEP